MECSSSEESYYNSYGRIHTAAKYVSYQAYQKADVRHTEKSTRYNMKHRRLQTALLLVTERTRQRFIEPTTLVLESSSINGVSGRIFTGNACLTVSARTRIVINVSE